MSHRIVVASAAAAGTTTNPQAGAGATAPSGSGGTSSTSSSTAHSILSDKVTRALQVRTDNVAMKAALDALEHLHYNNNQDTTDVGTANTTTTATNTAAAAAAGTTTASTTDGSGSSSSNFIKIDSRNVRSAIEQDALYQAQQLQNALNEICTSTSELRIGCTKLAKFASQIRQIAYMSTAKKELPTRTILVSASASNNNNTSSSLLDAPTSDTTNTTTSPAAVASDTNEGRQKEEGDVAISSSEAADTAAGGSTDEAESHLAQVLADAFERRDVAKQRLYAVNAFLDKFHLSDDDNRLLETYDFRSTNNNDGVDHIQQHEATINGLAFLHALERIRQIRVALNETYGGTGSSKTNKNKDHNNNKQSSSSSFSNMSALSMMESLSQKQERAYERLYQYLQQQLIRLNQTNEGGGGGGTMTTTTSSSDDDLFFLMENAAAADGGGGFLPMAIYTLRYVPAFYRHILELVASSRRSHVTRQFLVALTSGDGNNNPPMELKAHDSVAYVGDMLAFAFKAFSVEADLAHDLLHFSPETFEHGEEEGDDTAERKEQQPQQPEPHHDDDDDDDEDTAFTEKPLSAEAMLALSVSGLARPLKSRILQVVSTLARNSNTDDKDHQDDNLSDDDDDDDDLEEEGTVVRTKLTRLYEICGLLLFYISAMEKGVGKIKDDTGSASSPSKIEEPTNPLLECLVECLTEASKSYEATIRVYAAMLDQLSVMTGDSEASLVEQLLVKLTHVRMQSPGFMQEQMMTTAIPSETTVLTVEWVTETLVEASKIQTLDDAVALKQSLAASKRAGMNVTAAEKLDESIEDKERILIDELVETETAQLLDLCGLGALAQAWKQWKQQLKDDPGIGTGTGTSDMASYPGLSQERVEAGMVEFYGSLYSPPLPTLTIKDPQARKNARSKIAEAVCEVYSGLYESIKADGSGYADTSFLGHTPEQVTTLFSV